jgi:arylsulfatase A-like enzyme
MMGYRTPNIDRIAREGAIFTDHYAQQSCTAGRAAFITGQSCFRTGLLKVGLPGAKEGLSEKDPTLAELLKPQGYATGQFGKNHLGDRNEHLPTVHGFDEFFGNLYHLNAEEEPENPDYPSAGLRGPASENVRGVSAAPEAGQLLARSSAGEAAGGRHSRALNSRVHATGSARPSGGCGTCANVTASDTEGRLPCMPSRDVHC